MEDIDTKMGMEMLGSLYVPHTHETVREIICDHVSDTGYCKSIMCSECVYGAENQEAAKINLSITVKVETTLNL